MLIKHMLLKVIDEADRLLNQSFNDWLKTALSHIEGQPLQEDLFTAPAGPSAEEPKQADPVAPALLARTYPCIPTDLDKVALPSVRSTKAGMDNNAANETCWLRLGQTQKLLFSATLTRDPARVAALHLHKPIYLAVTEKRKRTSSTTTQQDGDEAEANDDEDPTELLDSERRFALPSTLKEHLIVCTSSNKPLVLLYLLYSRGLRNVLCFTKSVESAARLMRLVEFFGLERAKTNSMSTSTGEGGATVSVAGYSSDLRAGERKEVLARFKSGEVQMWVATPPKQTRPTDLMLSRRLVCSDLIARGMDLPTVEHVINYDVPVDMRKYVHRVGRTARAGREGDAWSLVEPQEAAWFKGMMKEAGRWERIGRTRVAERELEGEYGVNFEVGREFYGKGAGLMIACFAFCFSFPSASLPIFPLFIHRSHFLRIYPLLLLVLVI